MDVDQSSCPRRPPVSTPGYLDPESSRLREEYRRYR
jgi:hypothetical protein